VTSIFELDLAEVKMNRRASYLGRKWFRWKSYRSDADKQRDWDHSRWTTAVTSKHFAAQICVRFWELGSILLA